MSLDFVSAILPQACRPLKKATAQPYDDGAISVRHLNPVEI
jgi:hypothetical protein